MIKEWQYGKPPNEQVVEVEYGRKIIKVKAIWGRDGTLPHWEAVDGVRLWSPNMFKRWRLVK